MSFSGFERISVKGYGVGIVVPVEPFTQEQQAGFLNKYQAFISKHIPELRRLAKDGQDPEMRISARFNRIIKGFAFGARRGWVTDTEFHQRAEAAFLAYKFEKELEACDTHAARLVLADRATKYVKRYIEENLPRDKDKDQEPLALPRYSKNGYIPGVVFMFPQQIAA